MKFNKNIAYKYYLILLTIPKLGILNVLYIVWYRLSLKFGIRKLFFKTGTPYNADFFHFDKFENEKNITNFDKLKKNVEELKNGTMTFFSYHKFQMSSPPDWSYDPFNNVKYPETKKHWCEINEFSNSDIKIFWELSRFQWLVTFARYYKETNDSETANIIQLWVQDWINNNPLNIGPQWKCGQECSLRILHTILAGRILSKTNLDNPKESFQRFIYEHANRVVKNIRYACAQDNNHGTSEALGLFLAGSLLKNSKNITYKKASKKFLKTGVYRLEERVKKLVLEDGSFSQRSTNYHRMLLDTLSIAEYFRIEFSRKEFSKTFYQRAKAATNWLNNFIANEETGDVPNFGHNDGAHILALTTAKYRDYRPSVNIASYFFLGSFEYDIDFNNEFLSALDLNKKPNIKTPKESIHFKEGGYIILRNNDTFCFFHVPIFKFRPSQNDVFHIDLWHKGKNLLPDSGSYSYNCYEERNNNFYHNIPKYKNDMKKIGKFLYANWRNVTNAKLIEKEKMIIAEAKYKSYYRSIELDTKENILKIFDINDLNKHMIVFLNCNLKNLKKFSNLQEFKYERIKSKQSKFYLQVENIDTIVLTFENNSHFKVSLP